MPTCSTLCQKKRSVDEKENAKTGTSPKKLKPTSKKKNIETEASPSYSFLIKDFPMCRALCQKMRSVDEKENAKKDTTPKKLKQSIQVVSKKDEHNFIKPLSISVLNKTNQESLSSLSIQKVNESQIEFWSKVLGEDAQGIVRMGKYCNGIVAIKTMQKGRHEKSVIREIKLLDKIRHTNIICIAAYCSSPTQIHIIMEYFKSSNLHDIIFEKI